MGPSRPSAAHEIFWQNGPLRWQLEALALNGTAIDRILKQTGVTRAVAGAFYSTFFDVLRSLEATDWIRIYAVRVGSGGPPAVTEGDLWRVAAVMGGPALLELLINDYLGRTDYRAALQGSALAAKARATIRLITMPNWADVPEREIRKCLSSGKRRRGHDPDVDACFEMLKRRKRPDAADRRRAVHLVQSGSGEPTVGPCSRCAAPAAPGQWLSRF